MKSVSEPEIIIADREMANALRIELKKSTVNGVRVRAVAPSSMAKSLAVDAVFLPLSAGERLGLPPSRKSRILKTSPSDRKIGLPRYVVVGGMMSAKDAKTYKDRVGAVFSQTYSAARKFNREHAGRPIKRIGIASEWLSQDRKTVPELAAAIASAVAKYTK